MIDQEIVLRALTELQLIAADYVELNPRDAEISSEEQAHVSLRLNGINREYRGRLRAVFSFAMVAGSLEQLSLEPPKTIRGSGSPPSPHGFCTGKKNGLFRRYSPW